MTWLKKYPTPEYLQVHWLKKQFLDDVISASAFRGVCKARQSRHICVDRDGKKMAEAHVLVAARGREVIFDYLHPRIREFNERHDIEPGRMRLLFADPSKTLVDEVIWQEPNGQETRKAAKTSWDMPDQKITRFRPPRSTVKYVMARKKERFLQTRFKEILLRIYGKKCCVSGCAIQEVLKAAHILPATDENSYDPRNGLLLRADLHRLFDQGLLTAHPNTRRIQLAEEARRDSAYASLHGRTIRNPFPGVFAPAREALERKSKTVKTL